MHKFLIHFALVASGTALVGPVAGEANAGISQATMDALDPTRPGRLACRGFFGSAAALDRRLALAQDYASRLGAPGGPIRLFDHIGKSQLPATGLSADARRYFDQGVALVYGFNHKAAIRSFAQAAERDPACAMCWWGIALANGPNINAGMDDAANRAALEALDKASAMAEALSPLERDLIKAQKLRYSASSEADRATLDAQYADAMMELAMANSVNDDLQILAAEAAMNTRPWDYWSEDKQAKPRIGEAVGLIEMVMARNPQHPQASHLYIHLMENGPQPKQAEAAADELARSGPASLGHLVHMPAHIYYRIGRYSDSMKANIAAARADEQYLAIAGDDGLYRYGYYPHNVHFLLTSAQMVGNMHAVASETERLKQIIDEDVAKRLPWVQAIHAAPSFALAQYASPQAILALTSKRSELAYVDAMRHYARAVAQALEGDREGYEKEIAALKAAGASKGVSELSEQGFPAGALVSLATHVAEGRWELANGNPAAAVAHFEAAEELEKAVPYNEPPFWYYPVAQSRGAAHYALGDYTKASAAFRKALFQAPNNGWALYGLSRSEAKAGNRLEAQVARKKLEEVWQGEISWLDMSRI